MAETTTVETKEIVPITPATPVEVVEETPVIVESDVETSPSIEPNEYSELSEFEESDFEEPEIETLPATIEESLPPAEVSTPSPAESTLPVEALPVATPAVEAQIEAPKEAPVPIQKTPEEQALWAQEQKTNAIKAALPYYQSLITEEIAEQLALDPGKVLPFLLATVAVDTFTNIANFNLQQVPNLIDHHQTTQNELSRKEAAFFAIHPHLNKPEYLEKIIQVATVYNSTKSDVSEEQATKEIGAMVTAVLGIQPNEPTQSKPAASPPPHTPVSPTGGAAPTKNLNEFEELMNFDDSDF